MTPHEERRALRRHCRRTQKTSASAADKYLARFNATLKSRGRRWTWKKSTPVLILRQCQRRVRSIVHAHRKESAAQKLLGVVHIGLMWYEDAAALATEGKLPRVAVETFARDLARIVGPALNRAAADQWNSLPEGADVLQRKMVFAQGLNRAAERCAVLLARPTPQWQE